jgi:hypothetical protein
VPVWQEMDRKHVASLDLKSEGYARLLNSPAVESAAQFPNNRSVPLRVPVLNSYAPLSNRFVWSLSTGIVPPEFALGNNRFWFSEHAVELPPSDDVYAKFADNIRRRHSPILILHNPDQMNGLSFHRDAPSSDARAATATAVSFDQIEPASLAAVDLISYLPVWLQFRYQAPTSGWLMIMDRWAPGWKAEVNGESQQILGADFAFRAVKVEAGMNIVTLSYKPRTWIPSITISWGTLLLFLIGEAVRMARNRKLKHASLTP